MQLGGTSTRIDYITFRRRSPDGIRMQMSPLGLETLSGRIPDMLRKNRIEEAKVAARQLTIFMSRKSEQDAEAILRQTGILAAGRNWPDLPVGAGRLSGE
jgi:hypothetical protein